MVEARLSLTCPASRLKKPHPDIGLSPVAPCSQTTARAFLSFISTFSFHFVTRASLRKLQSRWRMQMQASIVSLRSQQLDVNWTENATERSFWLAGRTQTKECNAKTSAAAGAWTHELPEQMTPGSLSSGRQRLNKMEE